MQDLSRRDIDMPQLGTIFKSILEMMLQRRLQAQPRKLLASLKIPKNSRGILHDVETNAGQPEFL